MRAGGRDEMMIVLRLDRCKSVAAGLELTYWLRSSIQRWSRFPGQNGGLAKVDSGFDYAANFSCSWSIA
jgi:hypothetical protein